MFFYEFQATRFFDILEFLMAVKWGNAGYNFAFPKR